MPHLCLLALLWSFPRMMRVKSVKIGVLAVLLLAVVVFVGLFFGLRPKPPPKHHKAEVYSKAAVATDAGPCSLVGR